MEILVLLRTVLYFRRCISCFFTFIMVIVSLSHSVSQWNVQTCAHHWANEQENRYLVLITFDYGVVVQRITNSSFTIQNVLILLLWFWCLPEYSVFQYIYLLFIDIFIFFLRIILTLAYIYIYIYIYTVSLKYWKKDILIHARQGVDDGFLGTMFPV